MASDIRVVLVKLADRLHNMRTLDSMRADKQLKIASETKFLYAPLAHRFGLYSVKSELEDLSMKYCESEVYEEIRAKLKETQEARARFIRKFVAPIKEHLAHEGYVFDVKARTKSISSIWKKMNSKDIPFEEVFDLFAIRIILDTPVELEKPDCWRVYSIVTDYYQPSPERLRDWISTPRANGYESLHTTVMSPQGKWVEVQIRSRRMNEIAEKGLAAHYKYKESKGDDNKFDRWITEIRELLESSETDALDFVNDFKLNLFNDEIYIFTPKGELRVLPTGSTILDFAYDIHTDIGDTCIGAKVNNRLMPLSYELRNGDQLDIITSSKQHPKDEWLRFVVTARAKTKIKSSLNEERNRIASDGKEILERKFKQFNLNMCSENIMFLEKHFNLPTITELYFRIAKGKIDLSKIREMDQLNGMFVLEKKSPRKKKKTIQEYESEFVSLDSKKDTLLIGDDFKGFDYQMAKCCNPIPGDRVYGFITVSSGIKVHRFNCPNSVNMMSKMAYRCIKARWKSDKLVERISAIKIIGIDQFGLVNKITEIISNQINVNMKSISFDTDDGIFEGKIKVMVLDTEHLEQLTRKFEEVEGVKRVVRWDEEDSEEFNHPQD